MLTTLMMNLEMFSTAPIVSWKPERRYKKVRRKRKIKYYHEIDEAEEVLIPLNLTPLKPEIISAITTDSAEAEMALLKARRNRENNSLLTILAEVT